MTMKELSQLHWLNVEIDRDKQRLADLFDSNNIYRYI